VRVGRAITAALVEQRDRDLDVVHRSDWIRVWLNWNRTAIGKDKR
jgi:hypothetical protein